MRRHSSYRFCASAVMVCSRVWSNAIGSDGIGGSPGGAKGLRYGRRRPAVNRHQGFSCTTVMLHGAKVSFTGITSAPKDFFSGPAQTLFWDLS